MTRQKKRKNVIRFNYSNCKSCKGEIRRYVYRYLTSNVTYTDITLLSIWDYDKGT